MPTGGAGGSGNTHVKGDRGVRAGYGDFVTKADGSEHEIAGISADGTVHLESVVDSSKSTARPHELTLAESETVGGNFR